MAFLSSFLIGLVFRYRYVLLFPVTFIEGPLVTMAVGFLVYSGVMNPWIALPIIVAADVSADVLYYYIGRFGERWSLTRRVILHFHLEEHKERVIRVFRAHGGKMLLFGKLTHALGAIFLLGAGYARMRLLLFVWYEFLGTVVKSSFLLYIGYIAGSAYESYAKYFEYGSIVVALVALALVFVLERMFHHFFPLEEKIEHEIQE